MTSERIMAPNNPNNATPPDGGRQQPVAKKSDSCDVKYTNKLPIGSIDMKFISRPFNIARHIPYERTSLETPFRFDVHANGSLGIGIDLVSYDEHSSIDHNVQMDAADEKLLEEDISTPQDSNSSVDTKLIVHVPINEHFSDLQIEEKQLQPYDEGEEKTEGAAKRAMNAAKESAKEMDTEDEMEHDDNDLRNDEFNKNTADSD